MSGSRLAASRLLAIAASSPTEAVREAVHFLSQKREPEGLLSSKSPSNQKQNLYEIYGKARSYGATMFPIPDVKDKGVRGERLSPSLPVPDLGTVSCCEESNLLCAESTHISSWRGAGKNSQGRVVKTNTQGGKSYH